MRENQIGQVIPALDQLVSDLKAKPAELWTDADHKVWDEATALGVLKPYLPPLGPRQMRGGRVTSNLKPEDRP